MLPGTRRQAQGFDSVLSTVGALVGSVMLKQRTQVSEGSHKVSQQLMVPVGTILI